MELFKIWNVLFRDLSVRKKILTTFIWITVFSLLCYIVALFTNVEQQENTSFKIDVAGRNRMISQKIAALSFLIIDEKEEIRENAKRELKRDIDLLESSLKALKEGGNVKGFDYLLTPTDDPKIISKINEIISYTEDYKQNALVLIKEPAYLKKVISKTGDDLDAIIENTASQYILNPKIKASLDIQKAQFIKGELLKLSIDLTDMYINSAREYAAVNKTINKYLLIALLIINLLVIIFNFILMKIFITKPISQISNAAEQIAGGNLSTRISYNIKDEFGKIVYAINTLASNLRKATEFITQVGQGNFNAKYDVAVVEGIDEKDNLSSALLNMRDRLKDVAEDDKRRNWTTEGMAKFGEILRLNNDNMQVLSNNIISNLVKYMNANQGCLFIINDNDNTKIHLELIACYAYDRKKYAEKEIFLGEGLVGQVWQEGEYVYLTDIPDDYIRITSGLGDANPRSIIIMPLKINEKIFGIIEIASFYNFEKYEIEFVQKLSESFASTISTAKINERTKFLLFESQQQSEELKAQEEEMRQNLEEMLATQEELTRKDKESQQLLEQSKIQEKELNQRMEDMKCLQQVTDAQIKTMNTLAIVSKTDLDGNITYVNDEFLKWSKYTTDELIGKNHRILKSKHHPDSVFAEMWKTISGGNVWRGEVKNRAKDGSYYWVDATIAPILNSIGKPKEYIAMRYVINDIKAKEKEIDGLMNIVNKAAIVSKTDLRGYITYVNDEFCRIAKYTREELIGKNHNIVRHPDMPKEAFANLWETISSGSTWRGQVKNRAKDGSHYWVDATIAPIMGEDSKPIEYVAVRYLITEIKDNEEKLKDKIKNFEKQAARELEMEMEIDELKSKLKSESIEKI